MLPRTSYYCTSVQMCSNPTVRGSIVYIHIIWATTNKAVLFIMVPVLCVSGGVGACPARVTVLGLCVCVCQQLFWHYVLRGGLSAIPTAAELREPEK